MDIFHILKKIDQIWHRITIGRFILISTGRVVGISKGNVTLNVKRARGEVVQEARQRSAAERSHFCAK